MVRKQLVRLVVGPLVAIRAQSRLIDDMIRNVLSVFDCSTRVVNSLVALTW